MKVNPNDPAYPRLAYIDKADHNGLRSTIYEDDGIPIRLHIAAMIAQGHSANPAFADKSVEQIAEWSFQQTDALIAAYNAITP